MNLRHQQNLKGRKLAIVVLPLWSLAGCTESFAGRGQYDQQGGAGQLLRNTIQAS